MSHKLLKPVSYMEGGYSYWPVLSPRGIRLYTYEQVPCFLKGNPYITDGYRAYLPSRLCLKSLFIVSNETVNIWSHLFGFLLFFSLGVYDTLVMLPAAQASHDDYIIYTIFLFCFQVCMLCSTGYHLFCCHRSEKTSRRWLALDYAGISVGLLGCYIPGVFYAFYCEEYWRQVYLVTVLAVMLLVFFAHIHPQYFSPQWYTTRLVILSCVSLYGVIPTVHWIVLNGGPTTTIVQDFSPRVMIMYLLAGVAFVFYVGKVPERPREFCGFQPSVLAHPGGIYVLLVAPNRSADHEVSPQHALPRDVAPVMRARAQSAALCAITRGLDSNRKTLHFVWEETSLDVLSYAKCMLYKIYNVKKGSTPIALLELS